MTNSKPIKKYTHDTSFRAHLAEHLKDKDFAREYEALGPEFELVSQIIALRLKRKMTQAQLAEKMGTAQPGVARLESTGAVNNLDYVRRVADALDARLVVRLVPKKRPAKAVPKPLGKSPAKRHVTSKAQNGNTLHNKRRVKTVA